MKSGGAPLAGPVVAGAVILDRQRPIEGLKDSKRLSAGRREQLSLEIRERAIACALGRAEVDEVDRLNVLGASMLAMRRAVEALGVQPRIVYVDGNRAPPLAVPAVAVIGGDDLIAEISAGSIIAKTARDAEMAELAGIFPGYGFERHKGYPTRQHLDALARLGPLRCPPNELCARTPRSRGDADVNGGGFRPPARAQRILHRRRPHSLAGPRPAHGRAVDAGGCAHPTAAISTGS